MSTNDRAVGIIPARMESTRFPGKVLAPVGGKPLIQWVVERTREATQLDAVLVATDSQAVIEACEVFGAQAVLTRADHPSGSDRIAEAAATTDAGIIVNIQGDEPLIDPLLIDQLILRLRNDPGLGMVTAATPIRTQADIEDPSVVKVVCDASDTALYFSRATIPHVRDGDELESGLHLRHLGIYGYRTEALQAFVSAPPSPLESAEKLEQLRALHLGLRIAVVRTDAMGPGVDHPADVATAEAALHAAGLL